MTEVEFAGECQLECRASGKTASNRRVANKSILEALHRLAHGKNPSTLYKGVSAHAFWLSLYFGGDRRATKTNIRTLTHEYEST